MQCSLFFLTLNYCLLIANNLTFLGGKAAAKRKPRIWAGVDVDQRQRRGGTVGVVRYKGSAASVSTSLLLLQD